MIETARSRKEFEERTGRVLVANIVSKPINNVNIANNVSRQEYMRDYMRKKRGTREKRCPHCGGIL